MTNSGDPDRLTLAGHLVEDPVGTDAQRAKAAEPSSKRMTEEGFALEQAERLLDRIDQRPLA